VITHDDVAWKLTTLGEAQSDRELVEHVEAAGRVHSSDAHVLVGKTVWISGVFGTLMTGIVVIPAGKLVLNGKATPQIEEAKGKILNVWGRLDGQCRKPVTA
jgi:hypothetical protein